MIEHQTYKINCVMNDNFKIYDIDCDNISDKYYNDDSTINNVLETITHMLTYKKYEICDKCRNDYIVRNQEKLLKEIENKNPTITSYFGYYYQYINTSETLLIKYHTDAINLGSIYSCFSLAQYYLHIKQYDLMRKYFLLYNEMKHDETLNYINRSNTKKSIKLGIMNITEYEFDIHFTPIYAYIKTQNIAFKEHLHDYEPSVQYFVNNSIDDMCKICFMETKCIDGNCGLCLEYDFYSYSTHKLYISNNIDGNYNDDIVLMGKQYCIDDYNSDTDLPISDESDNDD